MSVFFFSQIIIESGRGDREEGSRKQKIELKLIIASKYTIKGSDLCLLPMELRMHRKS